MDSFKIIVKEIEYNVERPSINEFFRVWNSQGTHEIIRDKNGTWIFHAHKLGSVPIPLVEIGQEIENFYENH